MKIKPERREFLVRSGLWLAAGAGTWAGTAVFSSLWENAPRLAHAEMKVFRLSRALKVRKSRKERRKAFRKRVWSGPHLIVNTRTRVVHWPHPGIFARCHQFMPAAKNTQVADPRDWRSLLGAAADKRNRGRGDRIDDRVVLASTGVPVNTPANVDKIAPLRFDMHQESSIREALALSSLTIDENTSDITGLSSALEILEPVLVWKREATNIFESQTNRRDKPVKQDWRTLMLYARLQCLASSQDWKATHTTLRAKFGGLGIQVDNSISSWDHSTSKFDFRDVLGSPERFERFHRKTVQLHASHSTFRRKLKGRVEEAKLIFMGADSSSGKDTRQGEGSSNLPSRSLHRSRRQRSTLARFRKYLRQKRRVLQARLDNRPHSRHAFKTQKGEG